MYKFYGVSKNGEVINGEHSSRKNGLAIPHFGMEWEIDGWRGETDHEAVSEVEDLIADAINDTDGSGLNVGHDYSLDDGDEIRLAPYTMGLIKKLYADRIWQRACIMLEEGGFDNPRRTAGIHIHINRGCMHLAERKRFVVNVNLFISKLLREGYQDVLMDFLERDYDQFDNWAEPIMHRFSDDDFQMAIEMLSDDDGYDDLYSHIYEMRGKFQAVNLMHRLTFELRIFGSTTNARKILAFYEFADTLVSVFRNPIEDGQIPSWSEFIEEADRLGHTTLAKEMSKAEAAYFWSE